MTCASAQGPGLGLTLFCCGLETLDFIFDLVFLKSDETREQVPMPVWQCLCQTAGLSSWWAHSYQKQPGALQGARGVAGLGPGPRLVMVMVKASSGSSGERLACLSFPRSCPQGETLALWPERGDGNGGV